MICLSGLVSGCASKQIEVQTRIVHDDIPESLLQPVEVRPREIRGLKDVGRVLVDAKSALVQANCQIAGVDTIIRQNNGLEVRDWSRWCPTPVVTPIN